MNLTPHFTLDELCYTSNKDFKEPNLKCAEQNLGKMYMLAGFAERIREIVGKPMIITSGYRCEGLNKAVGGSSSSQHRLCEAIDFKVKGMSNFQIACKIMASDLKFQQLIIESSGGAEWVHIGIGSKREVLRYKNGKYSLLGNVS